MITIFNSTTDYKTFVADKGEKSQNNKKRIFMAKENKPR